MNLIRNLFELGAIRFGQFTLKSGVVSPVYVDLRLTIARPKLLVAIGEALHTAMRGCFFDFLCGVPYTALPFATAVSIQHTIPMVMRRKEKKEYGTGKTIEGIFQPGQRCLVIEDVITSGQSLLETIKPLQQEGLIVEDIAVLVDREQGGRRRLEEQGFRVHAVCTLTEIVEELLREKKIERAMATSVLTFIRENQTDG